MAESAPITVGYWNFRGVRDTIPIQFTYVTHKYESFSHKYSFNASFQLGEQVFLLLEYVGEKYERVQYTMGPAPDYERNGWRNTKQTLDVDFPNLPYFFEGQ